MNSFYKVTNSSFQNINMSVDNLKDKITDFNKRDFYFFGQDVRFDISSIIFKKNCLILKFDNIMSVIFEDEAYITFQDFDFHKYFSHYKIGMSQFLNNSTIFHISILEYIFITIVDLLDNEFNKISIKFKKISKSGINNNFLDLQSSLVNLEFRVKELHSLTEDLINNKSDLEGISFGKIENDKVEVIIENYNVKLEDIYNDIKKVVKEIDNIQKITNIKLAQDRNNIAKINLNLSIISFSFSIGAFICNLFGMNLKNHIETNSYTFFLITFISILIIVVSYFVQIKTFKF